MAPYAASRSQSATPVPASPYEDFPPIPGDLFYGGGSSYAPGYTYAPNTRPTAAPQSATEVGKGGISKSIKCPHCKKTFPTEDEVAKHLETHTPDKYCKICDKYLNSVPYLREHMWQKHGVEQDKEKTKEKRFPCDACDRSFASLKGMKNHQRSHEGLTYCSICKIDYKSVVTFDTHMRENHHSGSFKCQICQVDYGTFENLLNHKDDHKKSKICLFCGKSLHASGDVNRHIQNVHVKKGH
ncbi:unnamed protein product [Bemisia tabaci]|uniref:C2H2-type domain-containing protein n=1 Tax=Bemisia tabaci TaxID=7038 RepID=A0A9P0AI67_BEMTA|nr:unnamed protein product [Bemisia tabaci]